MFKLAIILILTMQSGEQRAQRIEVDNYTFRSLTGCYLSGRTTLNQIFPFQEYRYISPDVLEIKIECKQTQ